MIYLDHNATAPLLPEAQAAMTDAMALTGNPSSVHAAGRAARTAVETARREVAALAGVRADRVVFTSGGTEANLLALAGWQRANPGGRILVSAVEHPSVLAALDTVETLPVDGDGLVDPAAVERALAGGGAALVSVMLANNETGAVQPVAEIAAVARRHGAAVHTDAVQAAGRVALDFEALGADMMTLSAHKIGGPAGVGALILRDPAMVAPVMRGGGQERRLRGGTENLIGIAGFGAAAKAAREGQGRAPALAALRGRLESGVLAAVPGARVLAADARRLPNTTCLSLPGLKAETQVMALDLDGFAVSAGSACSSGKVARSHVLAAMGVDEAVALGAIRVSLGYGTTEAEIDAFVAAWARLYQRARAAA
ncbi:MAG: cysteine desulfurase family protein [Alphaproteobacteria bacterium]